MMLDAERRALSALRFNLAPTPDNVWRPSPFNVADLHKDVVESVFDGVSQARGGDESNPLGVVIQGPAGAGKTHMLGMVRARTQHDGGYFFLVSLLNGKTFWQSTLLSIVDGLQRESTGWSTQLKAFLRRLTSMVGIPVGVRDAIAGEEELTPEHLATFIAALRQRHRVLGQETQDTLRAMVMLGSKETRDTVAWDIAYAYLNTRELTDFQERALWGITGEVRPAQLVIRDISRLLALTGSPTVIAIDQIDTLIAHSTRQLGSARGSSAVIVGEVADGLINLRDGTRRALIVLSCLPDTWDILKTGSANPVPDRFREAPYLGRVSNAKIGQAIVRKRLDACYSSVGFRPPYPTWPIKPMAFTEADHFTPRALLRRVQQHASACIRAGEVTELEWLEEDAPTSVVYTGSVAEAKVPEDALAALDERFGRLVKEAGVDEALTHATEDRAMPRLLAAGLSALIEEMGGAFKQDPPPSAKPALHARLRETLNEALEDERHWSLRAIASNHAVAVIARIQAASTMAGLDADVPERRLYLLRNTPWPKGPKTTATVSEFHEAGGRTLPLSREDLRVFDALRIMQSEQLEHFEPWLRARQPATTTDLFQAIFGDRVVGAAPAGEPDPGGAVPALVAPEPAQAIRLGSNVDTGEPLDIELEALRKHMVIFAGSGSGKTVLIRRIVEECARKGVSAIVLDPNNDLARLGDAWPHTPPRWGDGRRGDGQPTIWRARRHHGVDAADRGWSAAELPAAAGFRRRHRRARRVRRQSTLPWRRSRQGQAWATPRPRPAGQAVLREALEYFARRGEAAGSGFIGLLDRPAGRRRPDSARREGRAGDGGDPGGRGEVIDPLFGGDGEPVDAGNLLSPAPGRRARVSVISLIGLPGEEQRQSFVNQLQLELFSWAKRNPAGDRPLGGLFVMDEAQTFAPSGATTPCTKSTLALVSQLRKYGIGMVFATQAPKGLHNLIPGNATTQFFGLLNAPAHIEAAKGMAKVKGGDVPDIGKLGVGQFYAAGEDFPFGKIQTPLCLTHHPNAPLIPDEVIERARREPPPRNRRAGDV